MEYITREDDGDTVVAMSGRFTHKDYTDFLQISATLRAAASERFVLDLSALEFIDSGAVGMLLLVREVAQKRRIGLVLRGAQGQVRQTIATAQLKELFAIE